VSLCLIGLGSNEGDRRAVLALALEELGRRPGIAVVRQSRLIETAPVGGPRGQGLFLNAAALLETTLSPEALLAVLQQVEDSLGRRRATRWGPRTIDLDLLLFDQHVISTPSLTVPHPRMAWRRFVLEPAAEVAPGMIHPILGWSVARLWDHLCTARQYLAITGPIASGKTWLSKRLAAATGACWIADGGPSLFCDAASANPVGDAEEAELASLAHRARLVAQDSPVWREARTFWVSDFWLGQSLAFARTMLPEDRWGPFFAHWQEIARQVVRPKLIVALDVPAATIRNRLAEHGSIPASWTGAALERFRVALDWCLGRAEVGPVLRLNDTSSEQALEEVLAAVEAMR